MNVNIEEINSIKRQITIELPAETAAKVKDKHLNTYAGQARLKGFRPGKAPKSIIAKIYADDLRRAVLEEVVSNHVPTVLAENDINPVGMPMLEEVTYEEGQPFKFTVSVEIRPVFASPTWEGLELRKARFEVTDEMVDQKLEELRWQLSTVSQVAEDRPVQEKDLVNLEYQGYDGDQPVPQMKAGPFNVDLGSGQIADDFENGLLGMKVGETKDIPVTLPENINDKEMAGKSVVLRTTVKEIKTRDLPGLDDELAKDLGFDGVETLGSLKEKVRKDLIKGDEDRADRDFNRQLTDTLAGLVEFEVPSAMVELEVDNVIRNMLSSLGRGADLKKLGLDEETMREKCRPNALISVKSALVLEQLANDNKVEVTDEDLESELELMAQEYGQPVDVIRSYYKTKNLFDTLRHGLKVTKTLKMIKDKSVIKEVDSTTEEPAADGGSAAL